MRRSQPNHLSLLSTLFTILSVLATPIVLRAQTSEAVTSTPVAFDKRNVTIWSDGTRMAGDLYLPKDLKPQETLPAVIYCNGTAGVKSGSATKLAPYYIKEHYVFLCFDYRGWGQSDSKLMSVEKQPAPDADGEITVKTRAIRWQLDFADQTADIRAAISFLCGETNVDKNRIGLIGTSYGGGLVTWVAGNDPRVKAVAAQVPGMNGGRGPKADQYAYDLFTRQSRAETEPVPFETGKLGGKLAVYGQMRVNPAKSIGYSAIAAAETINAPMIILVAEKEELMDNRVNGQKVYETLKARGIASDYHVIKNITHYGVYREAFDEAAAIEIDWFNRYLRSADPSSAPK